jgi:hypothetical protein
MIAAHIENLLFLLLIVAAGLFQLLAKKTAGKTGKDQTKRTSTPIPRTPTPISRAPRESDAEQIRKLLEALGQPSTSNPPPRVAPRTNIPARPLLPVQPPTSPLSQLRREQQSKRDVIPKETAAPPTVARVEIVRSKISGAPAFEVHKVSAPIAPPAVIRTGTGVTQTIVKTGELRIDITSLLASVSGLRDAIILREILGPPRGLRMQIEFSDGIS